MISIIVRTPLRKVFLAQRDAVTPILKTCVLSTPTSGGIEEQANGAQKLILNQGKQYEGEVGRQDYRVVEFEEYQIQIAEQQPAERKRTKTKCISNRRPNS